MARLFTAVELTADVREAIDRSSATLMRDIGDAARRLRRVRPEHLHVTLVFLGEIPDAQVAAVTATLRPPIGLPAFDIGFDRVGTFPSRGPARVLWLGIGEGRDACHHLHELVAVRLAAVGVKEEARRFAAHLTIGRWPERSGPIVHDRWPLTVAVPRLRVSAVTLFRSDLRPQGPAHTALLVTPLADTDGRLH